MQRARIQAWSVHLFTASGVIAGILGLECVWQKNIAAAFSWMMLAVLIDSVDGILARFWQVQKYIPEIDGRRLDDMVDYFTWVILPVIAMHWWGWLPPWLWILPLLSSAIGMSNSQAKTDDAYFLGFPSLWNIVALYLWHWNLPVVLNGAIVVTLSLCVMLPIRFIYPSRTPHWRILSMCLMAIWMLLVLGSLMLQNPLAQQCFYWSNIFPLYYLSLSLYLHLTSRISLPSNSNDKPVDLESI